MFLALTSLEAPVIHHKCQLPKEKQHIALPELQNRKDATLQGGGACARACLYRVIVRRVRMRAGAADVWRKLCLASD